MNEIMATIDDAWDHLDAGEPDNAALLARHVLARAPDAIDAFVVLAATCSVPAEAIALLREAVRIGSRAATVDPRSGGEPSIDYDWRAHVRALGNLARLLWSDARPGARAEALAHARRALRYDPDDRAGTRFLLMAWEAAAGNWAAARRITRRYRDEYRTEVRYWLALHAYRDKDDQADALRDKAIATNPHVVSALHGRLVSIRLPTGSYGFGSPDEAAIYAADAREGWRSTRSALAWLLRGQPIV